MPNWCSNRMYFSGEPAQIAEIKRLASGAVTPFYRRATNEGIQLFLAGSAGLLQTTEDVQFEPCPGLTAAGRGVVSPENIAFTRWLTHLQNGVLLDEQNCLMLHELWLQSGTGQRRWEGLPDDVRDTITALFTAKRGDWCGFWSNEDVSVWWNRLCDNVLPEKTMPFATAFFRCLNGSRRISLTDLRFFAPALTKEEFHGNRLLWLAAVDKLIESFGEVCVLPLPSDAGHRLFPSVPFREGERRRQKTTLTEQKYSRQREREAERRELEYQTCFAQAQIDLAFHTPATVGSWLSRWSGVVEEHDLETIFWGWCGRFPSLSSFDRFFWQEEPLWRLIFEAGEAGRGAPVQVRALEQWMIPNKLENVI